MCRGEERAAGRREYALLGKVVRYAGERPCEAARSGMDAEGERVWAGRRAGNGAAGELAEAAEGSSEELVRPESRGRGRLKFPAFSGRVAQLVRAPASHAGGHRFESCRAHHPTFFSRLYGLYANSGGNPDPKNS